jgi:hypothetical protein
MVPLLGIVVPSLVAFDFVTLIEWRWPGATTGGSDALIVLPIVGLMVLAICGSMQWIMKWVGRRMEALDRTALGHPGGESEYVGVAYADGFWTLRNEMSWDRGFLDIGPDGLVFQGHASAFAIPAHAIHGLRLEAFTNAGTPRIFVDWVSPDGEPGTMSLGVPAALRRSAHIAANLSLERRIREALSRPAEHPIRPQWPPSVSPRSLATSYSNRRIVRSDQALGILWGVLAVLVGVVPLTLVGGYFGWTIAPFLPGLVMPMFAIGYFLTLTRRVAARAVEPAPETDPVRQALGASGLPNAVDDEVPRHEVRNDS